uniref:Lysozyme n=1 Tax=Panagrolaimus sp. JU765 TaxID=591449 RepID=A0AC34QAU8_9BILA
MKVLIILCACFGLSYGTLGWDGIQQVSVAGFKCLWNNAYRFFIARVWKSYGDYDYVGIQNIKNARPHAGWKYVDGYIFPCLKKTCAPARAQVQATVDKLREKGAVIGILWLDIERFAWPADKNYNRQFIIDMIN